VSDPPAVDAVEARGRVVDGAFLLDVREPDEWEAGHAPEATWIPMGDVGARQGELPEDQAILVICRVGGRSGRVTAALLAAGYDATNVAGGMQAWAEAGYGVVTDAGGAGRVV